MKRNINFEDIQGILCGYLERLDKGGLTRKEIKEMRRLNLQVIIQLNHKVHEKIKTLEPEK